VERGGGGEHLKGEKTMNLKILRPIREWGGKKEREGDGNIEWGENGRKKERHTTFDPMYPRKTAARIGQGRSNREKWRTPQNKKGTNILSCLHQRERNQ